MEKASTSAAMDWSSESDAEEDEVVAEVDVLISKGHSDSLYLLQYPLRPADQPLTLGVQERRDITCEFKPKQGKLQLKLPLDVSNSSYDRSRGEQIAVNCGASSSAATSSKKQPPPFERMMDYQYMVSSPSAGFHTNCYAIGCFRNGQLHLTPLKNILQMRPSFFYLDAGDTRSSAKASADAAGESSQDESETEAGPSSTPAQTVRVKFKEESEYVRKRREASFAYQQKLKDEEPAVPLLLFSAKDDESVSQKSLLMGNADLASNSMTGSVKDMDSKTVPDGTSVGFGAAGPDLLRLLVPKAEEQKVASPRLPSIVVSLTQLRLLPLPDQVRTLMTNVKVVRFSQLLSLLPPPADTDNVLKNVQRCAQLVRGCWVVKSEILHPKGSFSPRTGASADLLCVARDYAMYRFTQTSMLTRREIAHAVKIPNEDIDDILIQLARFKAQSGWQFMYPPDTDFVQNYHAIAQQQSAKWEARYRDLSQHLTPTRQRQQSSSGGSPCSARRKRTDSGRNSMADQASDAEGRLMSPPPSRRRSSSGAAAKNRTKMASSTLPSPPGHVENATPSASHPHVGNGVESVDGVLDNYSPDSIEQLKAFLYDAFCAKPLLSLTRIELQLQVKLSESSNDHPLKKCIDERLIEACTKQLGATKLEKGYGEENGLLLFAFSGGSWPEVRRFLISFLQEKCQSKKEKGTFRFNTFKQACAASLPADYVMPNDNELKKLVLEYCNQKPGGYYILQDS